MQRPTKITPDPIIDAVVELRYESTVPPDAIFGMLFTHVKDKYPNFKKLPIAALPPEIRNSDPNLQFNPDYQADFKSFKLNVGPRVISLSNTGEYTGWKENYFPELIELLKQVQQAGIVKSFNRIGIRYIDFFELDIYEHINLSVSLNEKPLEAIQSTCSVIFSNNGLLTKTQVVNNVTANIKGAQKLGSILDTDTYQEFPDGIGFEKLFGLIDNCHEESVSFFFSLLKEEFLATLNPEYAK